MLKRIFGPLPQGFQLQHPVLRYALQPYAVDVSPWGRFLRIVTTVVVLSALVILGYTVANHVMNNPPAGLHLAEVAFRIVYLPLVIVQVIAWILALSMSVSLLDDQRRRRTWDSLRTTSDGAGLAVQAGWLSVLYRLRGLLVVITAARLILLLGVLYRLASHRGQYLDYLMATVQPDMPLIIAMLLLVLLLTVIFMLPFVLVGLAAALGLWLSAIFKQRAVTGMFQFLLIAAYVALALGLFLVVQGQTAPDWLPLQRFGLQLGFSLISDWGVSWFDLGRAGDFWAQVPYSVLIGPVLLLTMLAIARLIDRLLKAAIHHAEITD